MEKKRKEQEATERLYKPRTDEEIMKLATDAFKGNVFFDFVLEDESKDRQLLYSIFQPLMFCSKDDLEALVENKIACLYEYMSKAGPRSINGYPMFTSMNFLDKTDLTKMMTCIQNIKNAVNSVSMN